MLSYSDLKLWDEWLKYELADLSKKYKTFCLHKRAVYFTCLNHTIGNIYESDFLDN